MKLFRLRVRPLSPWCTPWQADTIFGLLCWACARSLGAAALRDRIITPCLEGSPPFVVSDAFEGDLLPLPAPLRKASIPWESTVRKEIRKSQWVTADGFKAFQGGGMPAIQALSRDGTLRRISEVHNRRCRESGTTDGGELFTLDAQHISSSDADLSIYFRCRVESKDFFLELMQELSERGFGAEVSTGRGAFHCVLPTEEVDWLDDISRANRVVVLSTYQPGEDDPTRGAWQAFVKYGKLGPDFGFGNVFKRPLIMLRSGAVFEVARPPSFIGRAIPMDELLSASVVAALREQGVEVIHPAFGLCVPALSTL